MNGFKNSQFDPEEGVYLLFDPRTDRRSPYVTTRTHCFHSAVTNVTVPKGFRFDFASVPRLLLLFFDPMGRHQRASLFHDAAYRLQFCSRWEADALFRAIMDADGVSWWRKVLLYYGVRLFGGRAWERNKETRAGFRKQVEQVKK